MSVEMEKPAASAPWNQMCIPEVDDQVYRKLLTIRLMHQLWLNKQCQSKEADWAASSKSLQSPKSELCEMLQNSYRKYLKRHQPLKAMAINANLAHKPRKTYVHQLHDNVRGNSDEHKLSEAHVQSTHGELFFYFTATVFVAQSSIIFLSLTSCEKLNPLFVNKSFT